MQLIVDVTLQSSRVGEKDAMTPPADGRNRRRADNSSDERLHQNAGA